MAEVSELFWCSLCGAQDDPLEDIHGRCTGCGGELIRIPPPQSIREMWTGIEREFGKGQA